MKCIIKLPSSCYIEFALVVFWNIDNSNQNAIVEVI